mmetsp:Transcript_36366/g.91820  ORF Transcript_36366/g.91820 Transcript_36366/m.91820 type:complete len:230 (-) Transcript_36366:1833-2522(-)
MIPVTPLTPALLGCDGLSDPAARTGLCLLLTLVAEMPVAMVAGDPLAEAEARPLSLPSCLLRLLCRCLPCRLPLTRTSLHCLSAFEKGVPGREFVEVTVTADLTETGRAIEELGPAPPAATAPAAAFPWCPLMLLAVVVGLSDMPSSETITVLASGLVLATEERSIARGLVGTLPEFVMTSTLLPPAAVAAEDAGGDTRTVSFEPMLGELLCRAASMLWSNSTVPAAAR